MATPRTTSPHRLESMGKVLGQLLHSWGIFTPAIGKVADMQHITKTQEPLSSQYTNPLVTHQHRMAKSCFNFPTPQLLAI
jgi:hypothetical protein